MRCPICEIDNTQVKNSRPVEDRGAIRRRRLCAACGERFTTYERARLLDLRVIKSDGNSEDFDRDKLERSIRIAIQKRPVTPEQIEQMISAILQRLENMGDTYIPSNKIGEIVMETLARCDTLAYIRFASVYKNFQMTDNFEEIVHNLRPDPKKHGESPAGIDGVQGLSTFPFLGCLIRPSGK